VKPRVELDRGWTLWPVFQLRAAGLPVELVAPLLAATTEAEVAAAACEAGQDERLRAPLAWQNPGFVEDGLGPLLKEPTRTDSRARTKHLAVLRYLQRYTVKNDTIGFFGPQGWGHFDAAGLVPFVDAVPAEVFETPVHRVRFEPWALQALADHWCLDPAFRACLRPTVAAHLRVEEGFVLDASGTRNAAGRLDVDEPTEVLLRLCDGERRARDIVAFLAQELGLDDGMQRLEELSVRGLVHWTLRVAHAPDAPQRLAAQLADVDDTAARARAQVALDAILAAHATLQATNMRHAAAVMDAQRALKRTFEEHAGQNANRNAGQTYAGRSVTHMDARRGGPLVLSPRVIEDVKQPLALVLDAARWFCGQVARDVMDVVQHTASVLDVDHAYVSLTALWRALPPELFELVPPVVARAARRTAMRVERLRRCNPDQWDRAASELFDGLDEVPLWPQAVHQAPDLMLLPNGGVVLGELHAGICPFATLSATDLALEPQTLRALYAQDGASPGLAMLADDAFARSSQDSWLAPEELHVDGGGVRASWKPPHRVVALSALRVRRHRGGLVVEGPEQRWTMLAVLDRLLRVRAAVGFSLALPGAHVPRRTLGKLIIQRETWRVPAAAVAALPKDLAAVAAWRAAQGLPARVFVKSTREVKPVLADLQSLLSVDGLLRLARGEAPDATLTLTEMLPDLADLWLRDPHGQHHVAELRVLAVRNAS